MGTLIIQRGLCPTRHACIAHCVSADGALGAGFAAQISDAHRMGFRGTIDRASRVVYTRFENTMIAHLITKNRCFHKPTMRSFEMAVADFVATADSMNKTELWHSPKLGCGLDQLDWTVVEPLLRRYAAQLNVDWVIHII